MSGEILEEPRFPGFSIRNHMLVLICLHLAGKHVNEAGMLEAVVLGFQN